MRALRAVACLAALVIASASHAQTYPSGNVRIIVPYPPGGPTDLIARLCAQKLSEALGHQFYVENVSGASGARGAAMVAAAPPDGQTLLFVTNDLAVTSTISSRPQYDPVKASRRSAWSHRHRRWSWSILRCRRKPCTSLSNSRAPIPRNTASRP